MMKKLLTLWMIGLTLMLVSCDKTSEFETAVTYFKELDSVAIEMVTEVVGLGEPVTVSMEIDGQNSKIDVLDETIYQYMEDEHYYMLVPFGNNYTSEEIDLEEAMGFDALTFSEEDDLFIIENFEEVTEEIDGVDVVWYVYQGDDLEVDTFKFNIENDMIHQMFFEIEVFSVHFSLLFAGDIPPKVPGCIWNKPQKNIRNLSLVFQLKNGERQHEVR